MRERAEHELDLLELSYVDEGDGAFGRELARSSRDRLAHMGPLEVIDLIRALQHGRAWAELVYGWHA